MNFLSKAVIKALIEAWAKSQGVRALAKLAADPRPDFQTNIPLSRKKLDVWTRSTESPPPNAPKAKLWFTLTLEGKRFWFYGLVS